MKCDVVVVTHKPFDDLFLPDGYTVVGVGDDSRIDCYRRDTGGVSIAEKNPFYSELTAQFWAWKNLETDVCGIVHYRRFFMDYRSTSLKLAEDIVNKDKILQLLGMYEVILSIKRVKHPGDGVYYTGLPDKNQDFHWGVLYKIIKRIYPEYEDTFSKVMKMKLYSPCNMFITKKRIFDIYSEWLFAILNEYDEYIQGQGMKRISRVDGYLSESLLNVFFLHHFNEKQIYRMDIVNLEGNTKYKSPRLIRTNPLFLRIFENSKAVLKYARNVPEYGCYKIRCFKK